MDPFIGEIRPTAFNFAPRGWAFCNGALLPIAQNPALFSLLGVNFGGDGKTTFGLPDLKGRIAIGAGTLSGGSIYTLGQSGGSAKVSLLAAQMAAHSHSLQASVAGTTPTGAPGPNLVLGGAPLPRHAGAPFYCTAANQATAPATMNPQTSLPEGGNQAHNNMAPYVTLNYIIALEGVFPTRP